MQLPVSFFLFSCWYVPRVRCRWQSSNSLKLEAVDEFKSECWSADMNTGDVLELRTADGRELRVKVRSLKDKDFDGADFRNADLRGINLEGANFSDAVLDDADLAGADCWTASFYRCSMKNARMMSGVFSGADFKSADLTGADLRNGDFSDNGGRVGADFSGANLTNVRWEGANFSGAIYDVDTIFPGSFGPLLEKMLPISSTAAKSP